MVSYRIKGSTRVEGFKELSKMLTELPRAAENRVLQASVIAAARVGAKAIKAAAPRYQNGSGRRSPASRRYGQLYRNIRTNVFRVVKAEAQGKRGAVIGTNDAFWGRFLEFGTRKMAARPWFRPAFERTVNPMISRLRDGLVKGIDREIARLSRQYGVK